MGKTGAIRAIAWVLALACFLLFCAYVHASFASQEHDCGGLRCSLCLCSRLKAVAGVFLAAVALVCLSNMLVASMGRAGTAACGSDIGNSLVDLKVKLSD